MKRMEGNTRRQPKYNTAFGMLTPRSPEEVDFSWYCIYFLLCFAYFSSQGHAVV
jgi:hypothetical protein